MTDDEKRRAAQAFLDFPFVQQLFDEIEQAAISACINAKNTDHEGRQGYAAEARAIRRVRQRLEAISKEGQSTASRRAPA